MKIQEALEKFIIQLKANGRSFHTINQYERHVSLFGHWMVKVERSAIIKSISHKDVASFLVSSMARTRRYGGVKKAVSMNALRSSLKGFFQYLHKAGLITQDPTRLTRRAICGTPPPRTLSDADRKRLFDLLEKGLGFETKRDNALFKLMIETGIRLGSAIALDVEDVDLDNNEIWLNSTKGDRPEKAFIPPSIHTFLFDLIAMVKSGPLFTARNGKRLSIRHIQRRFRIWQERAGIKRMASPHILRHTFASRLYQRSGDIFLVKQALKHRSITSTLIYAHADESRLKQILSIN